MLGDSLLVAPIFNEEGEARYYLPEGRWTHFITGEVVQGGRWHSETYDYFSLPFMARPNSIIAVGINDQKPDYDYADGIEFHLFEFEDGRSASSRVVNLKGEQELSIEARRDGETMTVRFNRAGEAKPCSVLLRGISAMAGVEGGTCEDDKLGVRIHCKPGAELVDIFL